MSLVGLAFVHSKIIPDAFVYNDVIYLLPDDWIEWAWQQVNAGVSLDLVKVSMMELARNDCSTYVANLNPSPGALVF